jgi:DNA-binding response OmpR family regulator
VLIVTRQPEIARLTESFAQAGMAAHACDPDLLHYDDMPTADLVLLDHRDLDPEALVPLAATLDEAGHASLLLVQPSRVGSLPVDLAVDDIATLPINEAEIAHRVARVLWRRFGIDDENVLVRGALVIDLANYRVGIEGKPVVLTFKEYELLRFLAMNPGQAFSRQQLLDRVWGYDYYGGARTVDVHIRRIRSKIETGGHAFIETIRNVGYRLISDTPEPLRGPGVRRR